MTTAPSPADAVITRYRSGLSQGHLDLPRCQDCDRLIVYPRRRCPHCMSDRQRWETLTGTGSVYSYTVIRRAQGSFKGQEPFAVGWVELTEGPRVFARIRAADVAAVRIGEPVRVIPDQEGVLVFEVNRPLAPPHDAAGSASSPEEN